MTTKTDGRAAAETAVAEWAEKIAADREANETAFWYHARRAHSEGVSAARIAELAKGATSRPTVHDRVKSWQAEDIAREALGIGEPGARPESWDGLHVTVRPKGRILVSLDAGAGEDNDTRSRLDERQRRDMWRRATHDLSAAGLQFVADGEPGDDGQFWPSAVYELGRQEER